MTGIIIMGLGVLLFVSGAFVYKADQKPEVKVDYEKQMSHVIDLAVADGVLTKNEEKKITELANEFNMDASALILQARSRIELSEEDSETEVIDHVKKRGDDFEKYVVKKFTPKYYNVVEWAGDKYIDGIYADTTLHPDLLMEITLQYSKKLFYVECKWRKGYNGNKVEFASIKQIDRYKQFEKVKKLPVFIALGIGGKASDPETMYLLSLRLIESNSITKEELKKYEKNLEKGFYFDIKENILK